MNVLDLGLAWLTSPRVLASPMPRHLLQRPLRSVSVVIPAICITSGEDASIARETLDPGAVNLARKPDRTGSSREVVTAQGIHVPKA